MAALPAQAFRLPEIQLAEILSALSHALDMVEGQPPGHCARCCWIGIHIGWETRLDAAGIWELYYTLLLKDLGCSSNAARANFPMARACCGRRSIWPRRISTFAIL